MKHSVLKFFVLLAVAMLFGVACDRPTSSKSGSSSSTQAKPYTVAADQVTISSAVLKGKITMGSTVAPDLKIGFQYSKSAGIMPSNSTTVEVTDTDANYNFSVEITRLEPSTTYYFRSFVHQNGADTYGETMSFTTLDFVISLESLDASDIKSSSATLKAKLDLTDVSYSNLEYGFYWGTSETSQDKKLDGGRIINNEYSALLTDLEPNTQYWFKAYAKLDGQTSFGVVKTFTTEDIPTPEPDRSVTVGSDHVSAVSAVLMGRAIFGSSVASDLIVGFQYSKSAGILPSNSTLVEADDADANYNYTADISGLEPSTTYYFRSFIRQNNVDTYGETNSFTTKELSSLLHTQEATSISAVSAKLNADIDLTDVQYQTKSFGFYWGTSAGSMTNKVAASEGTGSVSADLSALNPARQYFFQAYIVLDGEELKESVSSFTTKDVSSLLETLDASNVESRSAVLNARLDFTDVKYSSISYGFYLGTSATVQNTNLNGGGISGNAFSSSATGLVPKKQYWYKAYVTLDGQTLYGTVKSFTTDEEPIPDGAVDLGIVMTRPDGTKYNLYWATCNLCKDGFVSSPEKYGDYYAWGETEPKDTYSWSTYKFGTSDSGPFSKYNTNSSYGAVDNKTVLETGPNGDDVASKKLGGKWRMPTDEEWTALRTNCTWTWTSNYNNTGIAGRIVKSNVSGYTDKSIFLPAAGCRYDTVLYGAGSDGYYWSSSLYTDYPGYAWHVYFYSGNVRRYYDYRYYGLSVRPVSE